MVLPTPPININNATPNDPFYSTETYVVQGAYNSLIVGQNLFVDQCGCLSATPGGPIGTVYSVGVGVGLCTSVPGNLPITGAGTLALENFGPGTSTTNFPASITIDAKGRVAAISAGTAPVTSVAAGTGLCTSLPGNAAITTTGTIALCALSPNPAGTFSNSTVTVNAYGQVTGAVTGTAPVLSVSGTAPITASAGVNPTVAINAATPSACGAIIGCTSGTSTALGANAGTNSGFVSTGNNVALGAGANLATWAGTQLAIGTSGGNWIEGCNDFSIKPVKGVRDCNGNLGSPGQLLCSTGSNNVLWATPAPSVPDYCAGEIRYGIFGVPGSNTCLEYCGIQWWLPDFGFNNSLLLALTSGTAASVYTTTVYTNFAPNSLSFNGPLTTSQTYLNSSANFTVGIQDGTIVIGAGGPPGSDGTFAFSAFYYVPSVGDIRAKLCVQKYL